MITKAWAWIRSESAEGMPQGHMVARYWAEVLDAQKALAIDGPGVARIKNLQRLGVALRSLREEVEYIENTLRAHSGVLAATADLSEEVED